MSKNSQQPDLQSLKAIKATLSLTSNATEDVFLRVHYPKNDPNIQTSEEIWQVISVSGYRDGVRNVLFKRYNKAGKLAMLQTAAGPPFPNQYGIAHWEGSDVEWDEQVEVIEGVVATLSDVEIQGGDLNLQALFPKPQEQAEAVRGQGITPADLKWAREQEENRDAGYGGGVIPPPDQPDAYRTPIEQRIRNEPTDIKEGESYLQAVARLNPLPEANIKANSAEHKPSSDQKKTENIRVNG